MTTEAKKRVTYLFGAGASHASAKAVGAAQGILMQDLIPELAELIRNVFEEKFSSSISLKNLVNNVIDEDSDVEHVITFLDQSPSALHREFAGAVRASFESVLRKRLEAVVNDVGPAHCDLYAALLDMHNVEGFPETLNGFLTINYDDFLENAIARFGDRYIDFGIPINEARGEARETRVLKLHGSFDWEDVWPIRQTSAIKPLWIPPGIQKAKERYPFNILWGRARELLDCDVLRIVGCSLGPNDWDLVSLLFSTRHAGESGNPYEIQMIDSPERAFHLKEVFPYLEIQSMLEVEPIGSQLIAELLVGEPKPFKDLELDDQKRAVEAASEKKSNWFLVWITQMAETTSLERSISTPLGAFARLLG